MRTLDPIRHAEKRQEILDAAARCIARDGFQGASTADICREAGISPGHLYHYFASKEEILTALTAAGLEKFAARFAEMMQGDDAIGALIGEIGRHKSKKQDPQHRAINRMVLEMLVEAGRNAVIARIVRKNSAMLRALLVDFIESGQLRGQIDPGLDSKLAASMILSVVDGMRTLTIRDPDADIGGSLDMLQTLFARFLSPPTKR
jgi:TetR/AcrR family transcriptional regulator, repressor for uid operon